VNLARRFGSILGSMRRALFVLVLVVILPLIAVQTGIYWSWLRSQQAEEEIANLEMARAVAMAFQAFVRDMQRQELAIGTALVELTFPSPDHAGRFIAHSTGEYDAAYVWHLADSQGKITLSTDSAAVGTSVAHRDYFARIREGADWTVSELLEDQMTKKPMFVVARRIGEGQDLRGVMLAKIDPAGLGSLALDMERPEDGAFAIFDGSGALIYRWPDAGARRVGWRGDDPLLEGVLGDGQEMTGIIESQIDGQQRIAARVPVRDIGWVAGASRPVATALASVYRGLWLVAGLNLAVLGLSALLAATVGSRIIRRLSQLQLHAEALGRGDLSRQIHLHGIRELEELGAAFNRMGADLREARAEQQQANAFLEQRVQQRTAELAAAVRRLESEIRQRVQSEQRYRSLVVATTQIVWTTSATGEVTGDLPMWRDFTGQSEDQIQGWGWIDAVHPDDREKTAQAWDRSLQSRSLYETEYRLRCRDGEYRDVAVRGVPVLEVDGSIREWVGTCTDITDRKRAEAEIARYRENLEELVAQRTEELARSNRELEQFAYVASHDLQEPLRVVASYTQLLEGQYKGRLGEEADEFLHYIVDGVQRMQQLISDLLSFSRVGNRGKPLRPTDTGVVVERVLANLQKAIEETGAAVTHDPLPTVQADETQLVQLFQNLIGNAIKFRGQQPPRIHVSAEAQDRRWCFSVRDNGIGIEPQYWEQIFAIFQRLHTRKKYPGTGIGLAICKKIVERHGGRIWLESRKGEGTTFFFTIG